MEKIYSAESLKNAEKDYCGISLMEKAAKGIISQLKKHLDGRPLTIVCGAGNNGGDGWAVAHLLNPYPVKVIFTDEPKTKESIFYRKKFHGVSMSANSPQAVTEILQSEIILDCIFGIGLCRDASGIYKKLIDLINESKAYVISADTPSGISSDSGNFCHGVMANETICITAKKLSGAITPTKELYGKIFTHDIGVDMSQHSPLAVICDDEILNFLPSRPKNSHKGTFGTLKTLCGSYYMTGAGFLSINAALRSGVGLVKVFGEDKLLDIYKGQIHEPIYKQFSQEAFIEENASAALIGCGIGVQFENELKDILLNLKCPIILDADGINFLSRNIDICEHISASLILTPHPKEMAKLFGMSVSEVQKNRFSICKEVSEKLNCTVVLKGEGTVICTPNHTPIINETGNSGLAKGGSGDVLAGLISGFAALGMSPHYAAALGVYLHGLAADSLSEKLSEFSFLPSEIPLEVGKILAEKLRQN